jgi:hypothetical protein
MCCPPTRVAGAFVPALPPSPAPPLHNVAKVGGGRVTETREDWGLREGLGAEPDLLEVPKRE